jgi:hypothetical protein
MGGGQLRPGRQQPAEQCRVGVEGRVGHHVERVAGQAEVARVGPHHRETRVPEALLQGAGTAAVQLDGHHLGAGGQQRARERAKACTHIEDKVSRTEVGVAHEALRPAVSELVEPPPRCAPRGAAPPHGGGW